MQVARFMLAAQRDLSMALVYKSVPNRRVQKLSIYRDAAAMNLPFLFRSPRNMSLTVCRHIVVLSIFWIIQDAHCMLATPRDLSMAPV